MNSPLMNYKQVLVHEDPVYIEKKNKEYMSWEEVNKKIQSIEKAKVVPSKPRNLNKYEVLSENDNILYDITNELKEKFEFKGILNNVSVSKLIDIFANNMRLEEILDDEDEDDNVLEEDDNNF
jgi:hypothetical protein